jgi:hypothetical protein
MLAPTFDAGGQVHRGTCQTHEMTVIGRARGPWERGPRYVLGWQDEEKIIGPVDVSGLEGALEASDSGQSAELDYP